MIAAAKLLVIAFGIFFIVVSFLMFFSPARVRSTIGKAGSTNFINIAELTIRMIPAIALILVSDYSKFPQVFKLAGWFMLVTSAILLLVPREMHHKFSLSCVEMIKPVALKAISPLSLLIGLTLIYAVL